MEILLPYVGVTKFTTMTLHHFCYQNANNSLDIIPFLYKKMRLGMTIWSE